MKYIVFDGIGAANDVPIIFPDFLNHIDVANRFGGVVNVLGAGEVSFDVHVPHNEIIVKCYGESTSMKKKSRPEEDEKLIRKVLENY